MTDTPPIAAQDRSDPDQGFPRDCWVDIETGNWGLISNLRFLRQTELPQAISTEATPELTDEARAALIRCAGIDRGQPVSRAEQWRNADR